MTVGLYTLHITINNTTTSLWIKLILKISAHKITNVGGKALLSYYNSFWGGGGVLSKSRMHLQFWNSQNHGVLGFCGVFNISFFLTLPFLFENYPHHYEPDPTVTYLSPLDNGQRARRDDTKIILRVDLA